MKHVNNLNQDDALLQQLTEAVLDNLDNEQFGVEDLSEQIGISRSHLHRKLKLLKGKSVSQFIREVRLEEALKLLHNNVATTSEIAYRVGFNSPSYFHKCFHKYYGYPPGEVKNKTENDTQIQDKASPTSRSIKINTQAFATNSSIAVLPLQNFTGDPEQEYFVQGLHDALIGALGQISALRVISRTSTLRYGQHNTLSLQEIARELEVDNLVEGAVSGAGNHVRIQLKLIQAFPEERHLWAKEYQQDFRNILVLQSDVVQNIAKEIHVTLTPGEKTLLNHTPVVNPEAYKAYLKGMFYWDKLTEDALNTAMQYFELARELDPGYPLAYAGISLVWVGRLQQGFTPYFEGGSRMKVAAFKAKALELDNTPPEVHFMLGGINCWVEWKYGEAEKSFRRAISLNPNYSAARAYLSHVLNILHQPEEAMEQIAVALDLDPFNPLFQALYGMDLMYTRQYDKAIDILSNTLKKAPTDPVALATLRTAYHMKKKYPEALETWITSYASKEDYEAVEVLMRGGQQSGYQEALESLAQMLIDRSGTKYVTPYRIATIYTRAGIKKEAVSWLEKAYHAHDSNMPYIGIDPIFEVLRSELAFQSLLKKMKLPLGTHPFAKL